MGLKDELEVDIHRFFEQIEKQNINDKRETLKNLLNKYIQREFQKFMSRLYYSTHFFSNNKGLKFTTRLQSSNRTNTIISLPFIHWLPVFKIYQLTTISFAVKKTILVSYFSSTKMTKYFEEK